MPRVSEYFRYKLAPKGKIDFAELAQVLEVPEYALRGFATGRTQLTGPFLAQVLLHAPSWVSCPLLDLFQSVGRYAQEVPELPAVVAAPEVPVSESDEQDRWKPRKNDPEPSHSEADLFAWEAWEYRRLRYVAKKPKAAAKLRVQIEEALDTEPWDDSKREARIEKLTKKGK